MQRRSRRHSALEEVRTRRKRRANGVAFSADNRASDALRRLLEVVPRGLRRLWDGAPCPITLAQFPARQHLAGKIRFSGPALYYNYPLFTGVMHLLGARLCVLFKLIVTSEYGTRRARADPFSTSTCTVLTQYCSGASGGHSAAAGARRPHAGPGGTGRAGRSTRDPKSQVPQASILRLLFLIFRLARPRAKQVTNNIICMKP